MNKIKMMLMVVSVSVVALLSSLDSKVYGVTVNERFFSVDLSNNWIHGKAELPNAEGSGIMLIPTEFNDILMNARGDSQKLFQNVSVWSAMIVDTSYPFRNVPLEIYVQHVLNVSSDTFRKVPQVPTLIDGERALKIWVYVADNSTITDRMMGYFVFHEGIPYVLQYHATEKDFQKYLPRFEQIVKTFKFVKNGQEWNTTKQSDKQSEELVQEPIKNLQEEIDNLFGKNLQERVENLFEKDLNITDIGNVSEQELKMKIFIYLCNNPEKQKTWIDPEVLKYRCDFVMENLRDRGLIK